MSWFSGIVVYILTWWTVIFAVLPWGLKRDETGKPLNFNFKKLLILTSVVAALFWLIIYGLIEADIISFRLMADAMVKEDMSP